MNSPVDILRAMVDTAYIDQDTRVMLLEYLETLDDDGK
jgi:hypothetical protein